MQPDHEAAREAGASPDPSWHSDSDESDATNTTASTPRESPQYGYRGTRVGEALNPGPTTPPPPPSHTHTQHGASDRDNALRGMQRRGDSTPEGLSGGPRWMEMASWTQTSIDGVWEKGHLAEP